MNVLLPLLILGSQSATPDYTVPLGSSTEFNRAAIEIQKSLSRTKYTEAQKLSFQLPKAQCRYRVDLSKVGAAQKPVFLNAISMAAKVWQTQLRDPYKIVESKSGPVDILINFEPVLAKLPDAPLVAGAAWFLSEDPSQTRLETVIGLKRGNPLEAVGEEDVFNEALATFGTYYGLAKRPVPGISMGRTDESVERTNVIHVTELQNARDNLKLANQLRLAIQKKQKVQVSEPSLFIERKEMNFGTVFQGDMGRNQIMVANRGSGKLRLKAMGDCACIDGDVVAELGPNQTSVVQGFYATSELNGEVNHNVILTTNDPEYPVIKIPAKVFVKPRLEFVFPSNPEILLDSESKIYDLYLNNHDGSPFTINLAISGTPGQKFEVEPFAGRVLDFKNDNRPVDVKGYKLSLDLTKINRKDIVGRISSNVIVRSNHPILKSIQTLIFFQTGIVALPESIYMGLPTGKKTYTFTVARPQKPFKVLSIKSTSKHLTFQAEPAKVFGRVDDTKYTIKALYDGLAPEHLIRTTIEIETNDPDQKMIKVPIYSRDTQ
jgi:hypothetical protein